MALRLNWFPAPPLPPAASLGIPAVKAGVLREGGPHGGGDDWRGAQAPPPLPAGNPQSSFPHFTAPTGLGILPWAPSRTLPGALRAGPAGGPPALPVRGPARAPGLGEGLTRSRLHGDAISVRHRPGRSRARSEVTAAPCPAPARWPRGGGGYAAEAGGGDRACADASAGRGRGREGGAKPSRFSCAGRVRIGRRAFAARRDQRGEQVPRLWSPLTVPTRATSFSVPRGPARNCSR